MKQNYKIGQRTPRVCDVTGEPMDEGYCFNNGEYYCKRKKDAEAYAKSIGFVDLSEAYETDSVYFTAWEEDGDGYEWDGQQWIEI